MNSPNTPLLTIKAKCRGNDECLFEGKNIFLDVLITNPHGFEIGFPLAFRRKTGPIVRLIDTRTKREAFLKPNLADLALREQYTPIQPGDSVLLEWVITSSELKQFGERYVDVTAEIMLEATIQAQGELVTFQGADKLHIVSKQRPPGP